MVMSGMVLKFKYLAGFVDWICAVANTVSGAAQPALLYLVPSLLFGVFIVAASRREAHLLLGYKEELVPFAVKDDDSLE